MDGLTAVVGDPETVPDARGLASRRARKLSLTFLAAQRVTHRSLSCKLRSRSARQR